MSTGHLVMSSEVETSLITNSFYQTVRDLIRSLPVSLNLRSSRPCRDSPVAPFSTSLRSARNDNYRITGAALANLLLTRRGFPEENATGAGRRRHTLRLTAFADRQDRAHHARA
jgi:hypothetical protein